MNQKETRDERFLAKRIGRAGPRHAPLGPFFNSPFACERHISQCRRSGIASWGDGRPGGRVQLVLKREREMMKCG